MRKALITAGVALCFFGQVQAQDEDWGEDFKAGFESFRQSIHQDFEHFRKKCNKEYADFLKNPWIEFKEKEPVPVPKEDPVPPIVFPDDDRDKPDPTPQPLPYDTVVPVPRPLPQPKPIEPIREEPIKTPRVDFTWFGTTLSVRFEPASALHLPGAGENEVAEAWMKLSGDRYTNLLYDCLDLRRTYNLGDWAYLQMLHAVSEKLCGKETSEATLLMAYLYCQSGYRMRLARDEGGKLHMLFSSRHVIYDLPHYTLGNEDFYPYGKCPPRIYISDHAFQGEQSLSLWITKSPRLALAETSVRSRQSKRYPEMRVTFSSNKNLIDFYDSYPTSMVGDNFVSRWAMYANTPMSEDIRRQIYPALKAAISGCDQLTAVNKLLNFVQTGFVYEYDDKVWGDDRAFFAEESLYYPYCDCEDRSILFTRLVRDLLGLRCILIYYPGHLASAVEFTQEVSGDYIQLNGSRFVIADATFIGAPVGKTMSGMDNQTAKVILLE